MAAKSFASRFRASRRFLNGFLAGAVVGAAGAGLTALHSPALQYTGDADRKHCKFKPDPSVPSAFSALNEDYIGSGWSRGHMAPAGNNKFSSVGNFREDEDV
ncbi:nuclease EXOG [Cricetulus griseus]|uniref:Nuclease EXOG n=1 Tax=Cricetulus griseus TaxID=10029 RepID=A0A061I6T8_CRIGR|nr:nuclease EXOG [Cricetulus griseus]